VRLARAVTLGSDEEVVTLNTHGAENVDVFESDEEIDAFIAHVYAETARRLLPIS